MKNFKTRNCCYCLMVIFHGSFIASSAWNDVQTVLIGPDLDLASTNVVQNDTLSAAQVQKKSSLQQKNTSAVNSSQLPSSVKKTQK